MDKRFQYNGVRLGIDMGGTLTKFLVLDNGEKRYEESVPTPNDSLLSPRIQPVLETLGPN